MVISSSFCITPQQNTSISECCLFYVDLLNSLFCQLEYTLENIQRAFGYLSVLQVRSLPILKWLKWRLCFSPSSSSSSIFFSVAALLVPLCFNFITFHIFQSIASISGARDLFVSNVFPFICERVVRSYTPFSWFDKELLKINNLIIQGTDVNVRINFIYNKYLLWVAADGLTLSIRLNKKNANFSGTKWWTR